MDLFDVARSCARRWYIFIPLLLIVAAVTHNVYTSVKPVYHSQAVVGLTPPNTKVVNAAQGEALPRNGLLEVGGATFIANMTAVALSESSVADQVVNEGGLPDYTAKMFPVPASMGQLPLVMVEATDADPDKVTKTLELVVAQSEIILRNLQEHAQVPESQMVTPFIVAPPTAPEPGMPSRTRSTAAIFLAGVGLTVLFTVVLDILLTQFVARRRRISEQPARGDQEEPVTTPQDAEEDLPQPVATVSDGSRQGT